ncbi:MAG: threonine--tRNA ligase, partial [Gammaproteobacteria bacterium]|nr:threonine--tRNA ligase [Gammaproteobacteria bacterium]
GFTQDDAHIFCTEEQIGSESEAFIKMLYEVYADFGFTDVIVRLSTRPAQRVGSDAVWDKAEADLQKVLDDAGIKWELNPGEGAFYGPKIEFSFRDCLGRVWQLGTLQLDFNLPDRLGAQYVTEAGDRKVPVMLHRAIFGSLERFIGILLEHYADGLPAWLSPVQAVILNITDAQSQFCHQIEEILQKHGIRAKLDLRNEKIGFKIREHTISRVPYLLVVGDREVEQQQVSVRTQAGEDLGSMSIEALIERIKANQPMRRLHN